ncbi:right-handed parallel beta-helix repeat-containing protein [bacterium]|nr:right-handed parallel beta-helix repeat-containing protein [bacterium]
MRFRGFSAVVVFLIFAFFSMVHAEVHHVYIDDDVTGAGLGTLDQPYRYINDALRYNSGYPAGDVLHIHVFPGIYRETIAKSGWLDDEVEVIIEGMDPDDRPVVKGSDVFPEWNALGSARYRTEWDLDLFTGYPEWDPADKYVCNWYYGNDPNDIYRAVYLSRWEGMWIDGERTRQALIPGEGWDRSFIVNQNNDWLYLFMENGGTPNGRTVEATTRQYGTNFYQMYSVVLKNLVFEHCQIGVYASNCGSLTMRNCLVQENVWEGVMTGRLDSLAIYNSDINANGYNGLHPSFTYNVTLQNVNVWENNWRGADVNAANWRVAGAKLYGVSGVTMTNVDVRDNYAPGVWFDRYSDRVEMTACRMVSNYGTGLFWEISPGPITMTDCVIRYNGAALSEDPDLQTTYSGLLINSGDNVTLNNCQFNYNQPYNIEVANSGRCAPLWELGQSGMSDPIDVDNVAISYCTFTHDLDPWFNFYVPHWLDPENFWTNCIQITPQWLANLITPPQFLFGVLGSFQVSASPNPSNAAVVLSIELPEVSDLKIRVYDILGRLVREDVYEQVPVGIHRANIDGSRLASGMYFVNVYAADRQVATQKISIIK